MFNKVIKKATFAGGCFWCMQPPFNKLEGVLDVKVGYIGGYVKNPTYTQVSSGNTGHIEAVEIKFDSEIISYNELLDVFWKQIDPTDEGGQFVDRGSQYKSAIFYHNDIQKQLAIKSKNKLKESKRFDKPITTKILKATEFYKAEKYHQDFYKKENLRYKLYKKASGREQFIKKNWNKD
ncbi:MAG: peptide-methionine (S)-S-oxide reductase MsrA [Firmicutes bacterium]|nr:peptide-methionine (S)-S-oxide reductase MsrA [Bacillota bacterium]